MLAVVDGEVAALEGEGEPAEPGASFEQGDAHTGVRQCQRGGDPRESAADHDGMPAGAEGRDVREHSALARALPCVMVRPSLSGRRGV